uniref:Uncharacterized protein n=1 Tax=Cucumis melo TaxID=3656 RepID=A0A9I9DN23_CUCME
MSHEANLLIDRVVGIYGSFSPEDAQRIHRKPESSNLNPIDVWHMEKHGACLVRLSMLLTLSPRRMKQ